LLFGVVKTIAVALQRKNVGACREGCKRRRERAAERGVSKEELEIIIYKQATLVLIKKEVPKEV